MNKTIIVGGVESKSGLSNKLGKDGKPIPWTRYSIKDQADKFIGSTFSDSIALIARANIGKQVTLEIEERENPDPERPPYKDIVGAMPGTIATPAEVASVGRASTNGAAPDIRIAALNAAIQAGVQFDLILSTADKFASWLTETEQVQHIPFDPDRVADEAPYVGGPHGGSIPF